MVLKLKFIVGEPFGGEHSLFEKMTFGILSGFSVVVTDIGAVLADRVAAVSGK